MTAKLTRADILQITGLLSSEVTLHEDGTFTVDRFGWPVVPAKTRAEKHGYILDIIAMQKEWKQWHCRLLKVGQINDR